MVNHQQQKAAFYATLKNFATDEGLEAIHALGHLLVGHEEEFVAALRGFIEEVDTDDLGEEQHMVSAQASFSIVLDALGTFQFIVNEYKMSKGAKS